MAANACLLVVIGMGALVLLLLAAEHLSGLAPHRPTLTARDQALLLQLLEVAEELRTLEVARREGQTGPAPAVGWYWSMRASLDDARLAGGETGQFDLKHGEHRQAGLPSIEQQPGSLIPIDLVLGDQGRAAIAWAEDHGTDTDRMQRLVAAVAAMERSEVFALQRFVAAAAAEEGTLAGNASVALAAVVVLCMPLVALVLRQAVRRPCAGLDGVARSDLEHQISDLTVTNERLRQGAARLEKSREEERVRLAREVHDVLGSTLTALMLELVGSSDAGVPASARRRRACAELVEQALQTVTDLVGNLRSNVLDRFGLWEALRWKAAQFETRTRIATALSLPEIAPDVSPGCATAIYRIVEEALTNVARHSRATRVQLIVCAPASDLIIEVVDDGVGIPLARQSSPDAFGLQGMQERARSWGGTVELGTSGQGGGTRVSLRLPLVRIREHVHAEDSGR